MSELIKALNYIKENITGNYTECNTNDNKDIKFKNSSFLIEDNAETFEEKAERILSMAINALEESYASYHKKYPVVTLCGSSKFKDEFIEVQKDLSLKENIVISLGMFSKSDDLKNEFELLNSRTGIEQTLIDMHKYKINMSDEIFVINKNGYIGENTRNEIAFAIQKNKKINFLEPYANFQEDFKKEISQKIKNESFDLDKAEWITIQKEGKMLNDYSCSRCHHYAPITKTHYCPNCGAYMKNYND